MKSTLRSVAPRVALAVAFISLAALLSSQPAPREQVGPLPGGGFLLNSGWRLDPVGKQVPLDTLPMSTALSPDGNYLLVLNGGYRPPSHQRARYRLRRASSASVPVPDGWLGLAFAPKGDRVYVGGGSQGRRLRIHLRRRHADARRAPSPLVPQASAAAAISSATWPSRPTAACSTPPSSTSDSVAVINPQSGMVIDRFKTGRRPYRILFHPDGKSFFVTHWADGSLGHYDAANGSLLARRAARRASHRHGVARRRPGRSRAPASPPGRRACSSPPPIPTTSTPWASAPAKN